MTNPLPAQESEREIKKILVKLMTGIDTSKFPAGMMIDAPSIDLQEATQALTAYVERQVVRARHEQRHQPLGVSRWIAVGLEHGYWEHPMTVKKAAQIRKQFLKSDRVAQLKSKGE